MRVVFSNSLDVHANLASEDVLLDDPDVTQPCLFIYRNRPSVVIGKNQIPWRECATARLPASSIDLARRISGGGTVVHDEGNWNFSLIVARESYSRCEVLKAFIRGLGACGLRAALAGETSIAVDGRKVSGNAFCFRRNKVLHHGTLLWNSDLTRLRSALIPALEGIETRAIASVRMPVVNVTELLPGVNEDAVVHAIIHAWAELFGAPSISRLDPSSLPGVDDRSRGMREWSWLFGTTPDFEWSAYPDENTSWRFEVHRGMIRQVAGMAADMTTRLTGQPFTHDRLTEAASATGAGASVLNWLKRNPF